MLAAPAAAAYGDRVACAGFRVGAAIGEGVGILGRRFCSETLAMTRAICSWLALSCSTSGRIVASYLFLAGLELLDSLPYRCEIARHRLQQLHQLQRRGGSRRWRRPAPPEPEVPVVKLLPSRRLPERQAGPIARAAPRFRVALMKP